MGEELGRGGAGAHHAPPQGRGGVGSAMGRGRHLYEYYHVGLLDSHFTISRTNKVNTHIVEEHTWLTKYCQNLRFLTLKFFNKILEDLGLSWSYHFVGCGY